ncbi:MAG: hypothetical protein F6K21_18825 [Symploca sp. SIO2D2]|nr:hypothetical protein [Symploca sp. SIO2D2]
MKIDDRDLKTRIGFDTETGENSYDEAQLIEYLNIKLRSRGVPIFGNEEDYPFLKVGNSLLKSVQEKNRLLKNYLCPVDQRIQDYLEDLFKNLDVPERRWVPGDALVLERHGMARTLSLPPDADEFKSDIVSSFRVKQGVLNNPRSDRRTTKGVFHVAEGGLPIPADKKAVPLPVFAKLLQAAIDEAPDSLKELPFTSTQEDKARTFVSLMLRPLVQPEVPGVTEEKRLEVRFFAPGNLVSNLDFVESIFGNAGDPFLSENDSGLDVKHWSGHTGCVILAPHLTKLKKKDLGLPHISEATERQKRDSMCWESEDECYNDGGAFKITSRDNRGVVVTVIADNYYGYCKKEVKTQISFSANLLGNVEEEHAGGALSFASYDLGEEFRLSEYVSGVDHTFEEVVAALGDSIDFKPEGYAIDIAHPDIYYVPQDARFMLHNTSISWDSKGESHSIKLQPDIIYMLPSGYKVEMVRPKAASRWRLIGTSAIGTYCHKPCTVSGGGKSEISKSIADAIVAGPVFTADIKSDFDKVEEVLGYDFYSRFKDGNPKPDSRAILSPDRSIGSVIKLLSPSSQYTDEYNAWLESIPGYIIDLVLVVKRFYKADWGDDWRDRFSVDIVNGKPGNELKYRDQILISKYLRIGFEEDGSWRVFSLRKDFAPASKIQTEDDISASVVVPAKHVEGLDPSIEKAGSIKFILNCEYRLFQRPDDAIHRGYDKTTESDFSKSYQFFSNYEPIPREESIEMEHDAIRFGNFTEPMQRTIKSFNVDEKGSYVISSSNPRIWEGKPSKNPRYLQNRLDMEDGRGVYVAETGGRLFRRLKHDDFTPFPVNAVLPGRRNNPPSEGIRALAVFNPIHYQELPELFMDYTASLTGKSPSTTGAGSEGALTKGPFNALLPIVDLNNALVSYLVCGYEGFISAAGYVGPKFKTDHDISLLIPEIWSRMRPEERKASYMIEKGYLEACEDFEYEGKTVEAHRLGYRITADFVQNFGGRIFSNPTSVFPDYILKPELQSMDDYVDGIANIVETQRRVALNYFEDGSIDAACPPMKALLHIMAYGQYKGKTIQDPEIRKLFTWEALMESDWYKARLDLKQKNDIALWERHEKYLDTYLSNSLNADMGDRIEEDRLRKRIQRRLETFRSAEYREMLVGCLGVDPCLYS